MARRARVFGNSGYMHVICRGIGRQLLFEDSTDYLYYLMLLKKYSDETKVKICAYCLMDNHVHLLIFDESHNVALMMKKIGVCYSRYYNEKYDRTGHLFQDRYKSEVIENERYFLMAFRYILRNPQKAGICSVASYRWSSYSFYNKKDSFVDSSMLSKLIGTKRNFDSFINAGDEDECMEYLKPNHNDEWAKKIIKSVLGVNSGTVLQHYTRLERDDAIRKLRNKGLTIKQIERLTGINRGIIQRAHM